MARMEAELVRLMEDDVELLSEPPGVDLAMTVRLAEAAAQVRRHAHMAHTCPSMA